MKPFHSAARGSVLLAVSLLLAPFPTHSFGGLDSASLSVRNLGIASSSSPTRESCSKQPTRRESLSALSMSATSKNKSPASTRTRKPTRSIASTTTTSSGSNNLLQDAQGSINRELAEQFYVWEQEKRQLQDLEPLDFSMRSGLRWVHEAAMEQLSRDGGGMMKAGSRLDDENNSETNNMQQQQEEDHQQSSLYSDLVQEGLSALLQAMSTYDANQVDHRSWEDYAQMHIQKAMTTSLEQENHLIQIPHAVQKVVHDARIIYKALQQRRHDKAPITVDMVAQRLHMAPSELRDCLQWHSRYTNTQSRSVVSLESTVEISHPMLDDSDPQLVSVDDWEWQQGYHRSLLDHGKRGGKTEKDMRGGDDDAMDILEYLDDYRETEGDDDAWIQEHEQVAGLLQDLIPDKQNQAQASQEPSVEDDVLADVIRENLGSFLQTNLSPDELTIVQMTFGLEGRQPASFRQMASELNLQDKAQAVQLLEQALDKLRTAFRERYLEPHNDLDHDDLGTESV